MIPFSPLNPCAVQSPMSPEHNDVAIIVASLVVAQQI